MAICLGRVWQNFDPARWCGVRDSAHEKLCSLLSDPIPEVSPPARPRAPRLAPTNHRPRSLSLPSPRPLTPLTPPRSLMEGGVPGLVYRLQKFPSVQPVTTSPSSQVYGTPRPPFPLLPRGALRVRARACGAGP